MKHKVYLFWLVTFIIISFDLIFEYLTGQNFMGFSSPMKGRLSGFLGDELKIGHLYLGFIIICYVTFLILQITVLFYYYSFYLEFLCH